VIKTRIRRHAKRAEAANAARRKCGEPSRRMPALALEAQK
jgi:hypothetical protein